jgi:hypothetical protein
MITIKEMEEMLNEIAEELPQQIYKRLNGGIILLPETKQNPKRQATNLYILGQYHHGGVMGRYISIYYGSFKRVYGHLPKEELRKKLMKTLKHEFTHHLESMAGEKDLEIEDEKFIREYFEKRNKNKREKE